MGMSLMTIYMSLVMFSLPVVHIAHNIVSREGISCKQVLCKRVSSDNCPLWHFCNSQTGNCTPCGRCRDAEDNTRSHSRWRPKNCQDPTYCATNYDHIPQHSCPRFKVNEGHRCSGHCTPCEGSFGYFLGTTCSFECDDGDSVVYGCIFFQEMARWNITRLPRWLVTDTATPLLPPPLSPPPPSPPPPSPPPPMPVQSENETAKKPSRPEESSRVTEPSNPQSVSMHQLAANVPVVVIIVLISIFVVVVVIILVVVVGRILRAKRPSTPTGSPSTPPGTPDDEHQTEKNHLLPPQNHLLPLQNSILPPQSSLLPPQNSLLPPQNHLLPPQNSILPPQSSLLPPQNYLLPPQNSILPPQSSLLPSQNYLLPHQNVPVENDESTIDDGGDNRVSPQNTNMKIPVESSAPVSCDHEIHEAPIIELEEDPQARGLIAVEDVDVESGRERARVAEENSDTGGLSNNLISLHSDDGLHRNHLLLHQVPLPRYEVIELRVFKARNDDRNQNEAEETQQKHVPE